MKRLLAALALAVLTLSFGPALQARDLDPPELGCHRVAYTPPGWSDPIEVVVCP